MSIIIHKMRTLSIGQMNQSLWALTQIIGLSKKQVKIRLQLSYSTIKQLELGYNPSDIITRKLQALLENATEEFFQNSPVPKYGKEHVFLYEYRKLTYEILAYVQSGKSIIDEKRKSRQRQLYIPQSAKAQQLHHLLHKFLSEGPKDSRHVFKHLNQFPRATIYVAARNLGIQRTSTGYGHTYHVLWELPGGYDKNGISNG